MSDDATVVWLGEGEAREDAARSLREWARARGVRIHPPEHGSVTPAPPPPDEAIADRVEKDLARAREAINASDADAADRSLARASALLRAHPEAPQAAWQRAEVERAWAMRWLRLQPRDEAAARSAWATAAALDGGRVAGVGEPAFPAAPRVKATIVASGASADHATLYLDGTRLEPASKEGSATTYAIVVGPAEHAVLVSSAPNGRVLFADWIAITEAPPAPIRITLNDSGACGADALERVRREDARIVAAGVACPTWITAVPGERKGSVLVARCERDACGPLLEWRVEPTPSPAAAPQPKSSRWPAWATWTLLGIGAATAASVALVATGVFETRPVEPRFVLGRPQQE